MNQTQHKIIKIEIEKLKGLKDVEIDLSEKSLVAIMGSIGEGKSTILHALACVYDPVNNPHISSANSLLPPLRRCYQICYRTDI